MSGPWDRPSADDPDAAWPSEDLGRSSGRGAERDSASEGAPGWDDWPPAPPPPDDYLIEEPLPPSSDPWAESWTEEEADALLRSSDAQAPAAPPSTPAQPEPDSEEAPPNRWDEPDRFEPGPGPQRDAVAEPDAPRVEPWSPEPDPWQFDPAPAVEAGDDAAATDAPSTEPPPPMEAGSEGVAPTEAGGEGAGAEPPSAPRWPRRSEELPDWLAEPVAPEPEPGSEPTAAAAAAAAEPPGPVADAAGLAAGSAWSPPQPRETDGDEPRPSPASDAPSVRPAEEEGGSFWDSILPWRSSSRETDEPQAAATALDEREPAADAVASSAEVESEHPWIEVDDAEGARDGAVGTEPEPEPEARPEPEPEAEPQFEQAMVSEPAIEPESSASADTAPFEPRWPASVPEPWVDTASTDARDEEPPSFVPIGSGLTYASPEAEPQFETEPEPASAFEPTPEPDQVEPPPAAAAAEPEPAPRWHWEPQEPPPTIAEPADEPAADETGAWSADATDDWADRGESTRVLPTDWTPTEPEPRRGDLEPAAGPIRTRLAEPDADLDEEAAAPTIAEQAVPWLIGVILLLAGMVIVLLALIFAGDASLGGSGAGPTQRPSPSLLAVPPGDAETPAPTPTAASTSSGVATPTPEPTSTPEPTPGPQYGPLEMVYQGRAAALAPIYLLRRDFTLDEEAEVLAQDGSYDVRRFAWAPDGRAGAGLLTDILVSIEPGQEKRRLGDGLTTITFGDDGSTIYGVRVTEDGSNDVAAILAIDYVSGDTEELASVTYERPGAVDRSALAEARFSDDGGSVRLYWMHDDVLRLWVRGAGAWTVDPAGGDASEIRSGSTPTLVAPNGRDRIEVTEDGGTTTLTLRDMNDRRRASVDVDGLVSHLRWSPGGDRVVFTVGRSAPAGGILQDLFLWDLGDGDAPMPLTNTGAAFGAEWLGSQPRWRE